MTGQLVLSLIVAALIVAAGAKHKPARRWLRGFIETDRKGRTTLVIWPAPHTKKKGKRKR